MSWSLLRKYFAMYWCDEMVEIKQKLMNKFVFKHHSLLQFTGKLIFYQIAN